MLLNARKGALGGPPGGSLPNLESTTLTSWNANLDRLIKNIKDRLNMVGCQPIGERSREMSLGGSWRGLAVSLGGGLPHGLRSVRSSKKIQTLPHRKSLSFPITFLLISYDFL